MKSSNYVLGIAVVWLALAVFRYVVEGAAAGYYFNFGLSALFLVTHFILRELERIQAVKRG